MSSQPPLSEALKSWHRTQEKWKKNQTSNMFQLNPIRINLEKKQQHVNKHTESDRGRENDTDISSEFKLDQ